ncbi:MAG: hypothetical protein ACLPX9_13715 [Rhodomicrobium sp.]
MLRVRVFAFLLAALAATSARATHLSDVQGTVLVNNQAVGWNNEVVPGDRVKVVSGSAKIVYDNGASVTVAPGQTVLVLASPPAGPVEGSGSFGDQGPGLFAAGGTAAAVGYIAGGAAIAGGAGLAVALSSNSSAPKQLSP